MAYELRKRSPWRPFARPLVGAWEFFGANLTQAISCFRQSLAYDQKLRDQTRRQTHCLVWVRKICYAAAACSEKVRCASICSNLRASLATIAVPHEPRSVRKHPLQHSSFCKNLKEYEGQAAQSPVFLSQSGAPPRITAEASIASKSACHAIYCVRAQRQADSRDSEVN